MATPLLSWLFAALLIFAPSANAALFGRSWNDEALTLIPEKSRAQGEWRASVDTLKGDRRRGGINIEIREDRSTHGFFIPRERLPRIEGKSSNGSAVKFAIEGDAGDLLFEGVVKNKIASGQYVFDPNKEYAAEAGKLLKAEVNDDELLKLAFARITLGYIRAVTEAIPSADLKGVIRLRNYGLEVEAIKAFVAAGFTKPEEMTRLRSYGVTPEYAEKARAAGYGKSAEEVTKMRSYGVTTEDLTGWKDAGFQLSSEDIVKLRSYGVQPDYGAAWKKAGFKIDAAGLVKARSYGVPIDFAAALGSAENKPSLDDVVRMRQYGVSAEFYRAVKELKPEYTADEIVRLRQYGVSSDYIRTVCAARNDFTAEQIVKLRNHGVPADYVVALNVPDRKPLDAQAIIELRNRGVSAETARKLRE